MYRLRRLFNRCSRAGFFSHAHTSDCTRGDEDGRCTMHGGTVFMHSLCHSRVPIQPAFEMA